MRILSELARASGGISPSELSKRADMPRPSVYVFLGRLSKRDLVKKKLDGSALAPGAVIYSITAEGRRARILFAKQVGLQP